MQFITQFRRLSTFYGHELPDSLNFETSLKSKTILRFLRLVTLAVIVLHLKIVNLDCKYRFGYVGRGTRCGAAGWLRKCLES